MKTGGPVTPGRSSVTEKSQAASSVLYVGADRRQEVAELLGGSLLEGKAFQGEQTARIKHILLGEPS